MEDEEMKAISLMGEADKSLKRMSVWGLMSGSQKYEDAKDKYSKAANLFKMKKSWARAAEAFEKCAEMDDQLDSPHESLSNRVNAAEMWKRVDPVKAVAMFRGIAQKQCEMGRFGRAAGHLEQAAEILEAENLTEDAIDLYQKAADYNFSDNANSKGAKCLEKVAFLSANMKQFDKSAQIFEQLGATSMESKLLSFGAKKHFLHAGMCLLARGDAVAGRMACDRFGQLDLSFASSREGQLLAELIAAFEQYDADAFSESLAKYDRVSTLDGWETSVLLKVKTLILETSEATPDLR